MVGRWSIEDINSPLLQDKLEISEEKVTALQTTNQTINKLKKMKKACRDSKRALDDE